MFAKFIVNNKAKNVLLLNNSFNNLFFDISFFNSFLSDDMLAMKKSFVIRNKERSRKFINKQKLLFNRFNQRKSSKYKRVKEIFNIDSIDISKQTIDIFKQTIDIAMQQKHVEQMKQSIRRGRDRSSVKFCF